ncbi:hypothetical protein KFZ76_20750 [Methylovulum psychrotolerans]|uniref:hypothetical protein n=1 Tax=Methylovulum psychrotolerans TaxID=1704499 RepID=UPI001BFFA2FA|nr:hypothetical protein [Methylovulum psychrotolerans]MBT9100137.1 hypothetical protein [Methylovulum psychrotolerans]
MPRHPELYQWIDTIAMHFPSLSKPQALGLALWSFGMVVARSCSLTAVADVLSPLLGKKYNTLRERLRDTYREAGAKSGRRRVDLCVTECWAPWLACWTAGQAASSPSPWMRRAWGIGSPCWPSVSCTVAVPCRSPGRC